MKRNHSRHRGSGGGSSVRAAATVAPPELESPQDVMMEAAAEAIQRQKQRQRNCEQIAELCEEVLENAQEAFTKKVEEEVSIAVRIQQAKKKGREFLGPTRAAQRRKQLREAEKQQDKNGGMDSDDEEDEDEKEEEEEEQEEETMVISRTRVERLLALGNVEKVDGGNGDVETSRLAILSLLAVFQDVIPTYRIRLPTKEERTAQKLSKETKKIWDFERALLHHYQMYLGLLERTWNQVANPNAANPLAPDKRRKWRLGNDANEKNEDDKKTTIVVSPEGRTTLGITSVMCLCELLKGAPHFNFRSNILSLVVKLCNYGQHAVVGDACRSAIEHVFRHDVNEGEFALEAARLVAKLIRERLKTPSSTPVRANVLRTFLALPLRVHEDEAQAAKLIQAANAKKRKKDKEAAAIDKDLQEGQATTSKVTLARCQADTLDVVTMTYFQVLKAVTGGTAAPSENDDDDVALDEFLVTGRRRKLMELLSPALEGLAKFAHLINMDVVTDLLGVLRQLLRKVSRDETSLSLDAALHCALTAFRALRGPGREMQIDEKEYVAPLYRLLPRLCTDSSSVQHSDLVLSSLTAAFLDRREYSNVRVASFVKQICSVAMCTPSSTAVPLLALVRQWSPRYPSALSALWENEMDVLSSGSYQPQVDDPEHANPWATSAWEVATLKFHVHPHVAHQAQRTAQQEPLQLPREDVFRLRQEMVAGEETLCIPFTPPSGSLKRKRASGDTTRRKRQAHSWRFLKPQVVPKTNQVPDWMKF